MKITIEVNGKTYIPIAAIPYVTGGFFTIRDVVVMAAVPGLFAHAHGGTALETFEFLPFGRLTCVSTHKLTALAELNIGEKCDSPFRNISGMLVLEEELRDLMQIVLEAEATAQAQVRKRPPASWDVEAPLPAPILLAMFKHLPIVVDPRLQWANSADLMRERIQAAVERVSRDAAHANIPFDRTQLPGRKTDFIKILKKIDRQIARAASTLESYFSQLGLRWRQGSKRRDAAPLMALYGLPVD